MAAYLHEVSVPREGTYEAVMARAPTTGGGRLERRVGQHAGHTANDAI